MHCEQTTYHIEWRYWAGLTSWLQVILWYVQTITCPLLCLWWFDTKCKGRYYSLPQGSESAGTRVQLLLHMCSLALARLFVFNHHSREQSSCRNTTIPAGKQDWCVKPSHQPLQSQTTSPEDSFALFLITQKKSNCLHLLSRGCSLLLLGFHFCEKSTAHHLHTVPPASLGASLAVTSLSFCHIICLHLLQGVRRL